jgi:hypothetical protein
MSIRKRALVLALVVGVVLVAAFAAAAGPFFSAWSTAQKIDEIAGNHPDVNTASLDGCPIQSPDELSLFMASNRSGGMGGLDIWASTRASTSDPWGAPVNLGPPVNSTADDFCPTPVRGKGLFFVSRRVVTGVTCGLGDIYFTRFNHEHGWRAPEHLGCAPAGPNSALDEQGPSYVEVGGQELLYFSSSSASVPGDIFVSTGLADGSFGPAAAVAELNSAGNDIQPNVRKDGREIVFSSNRAGASGQDIWASTRERVEDPWSAPTSLGSEINTAAAETRPALSWDAQTLYFGRAPGTEGSAPIASDIYVSTRSKVPGADR